MLFLYQLLVLEIFGIRDQCPAFEDVLRASKCVQMKILWGLADKP